MSDRRAQSWQHWIVYGLLVLAISALWAFGAVVIENSRTTPLAFRTPIEDISFTYSGEPVIVTYVYDDSQPSPRLLDGQSIDERTPLVRAVDIRSFESLEPHPSQHSWANHRLQDSEQFWSDRSMEVLPKDVWYLLSEGGAVGRGYFAGFNRLTKNRLGSIGRKGFVSGTPPREDQFEWGSLFYGKIMSVPRDADDTLYFLDGNNLVSVNLRTRDVKTLGTFPGAKALTIIRVSSRAIAKQIAQLGTRSVVQGDGGDRPKLAVWSDDQISLVDPYSGKQTDFALPAIGWGDGFIRIYPLNDEQLVVSSVAEQGGSRRATLAWLKPRGRNAGAASRTAEVTLAGSQLEAFEKDARGIAAAFPAPLILAATVFVFGPSTAMNRGADSYADGLRVMARSLAPELVILVVLCAALAWWTYRREQQGNRSGAKAIAVAVLLLGIPGFLAYLAERRRTPMGRCAACGADVPQNRALCTACGAERARPRVTGVEVFA
jgi:hypothetical protein